MTFKLIGVGLIILAVHQLGQEWIHSERRKRSLMQAPTALLENKTFVKLEKGAVEGTTLMYVAIGITLIAGIAFLIGGIIYNA